MEARPQDPFELGAGTRAVLLIHGFTGAPGELRGLGEHLAAEGWRVRAPLLPGHGTRIEDLETRAAEEWFAATSDHLTELRENTGRPVALAGLSMGSLIALWLAAERPDDVSAIAAMSPPLKITPWTARVTLGTLLLTGAVRWMRFVPKGQTGLPPAVDESRFVYDRWPVRGLGQLARVMKKVRRRLRRVQAPLLVLSGGKDRTAPPWNAHWLLARVSSSVSEAHVLPESGHVLPLDRDAAVVWERIAEFLGGQSP